MEHTFKVGDRVCIRSEHLKSVYGIPDDVYASLCGEIEAISTDPADDMPYTTVLDVDLFAGDDRVYIFSADELEKIDARL